MGIKIRKKNILYLLVTLFLLADVRLFYLIPLPEKFTGPAANKVFAAFVAVISFGFYILFFNKLKFGYWGKWILNLYIIFLLSGIMSMISYKFTVTNVLWEHLTYFILLMYFPLTEYLRNEQAMKRFISVAEIITDITCILFLIQYFLWSGLDSVFLQLDDIITDFYIYRTYIPLRIYSVFEGFVRIFILMVAYRCIKNNFKKCKRDILSFTLMFMTIVFVDQSRVYLIILLAAITYMILKEYGTRVSTKKLIIYFGGSIAAITLITTKLISISTTIFSNEGSWWARLEAIAYYFSRILNHLIFGLGITIPEKTNSLYAYFKGEHGYYNFDDIGIFGVFFSFGIIGFTWYLLFAVKMIKTVHKTKKNRPLSMAITIVFILSFLSMSYLDKARAMSLLMSMVVLDYNYKMSIKEKIYVFSDNNRLSDNRQFY